MSLGGLVRVLFGNHPLGDFGVYQAGSGVEGKKGGVQAFTGAAVRAHQATSHCFFLFFSFFLFSSSKNLVI